VGDVYRDENQAAVAAVSQLRDENAHLRSQIADIQRRLAAAEYRAGLAPTQATARGLVRGLAVVAGLAVLVAGVFAMLTGRAVESQSIASVPSAATSRYFDPHVAKAALAAVDFSDCARIGATTGEGQAVVTFDPDGRAGTVLVDPPIGGTPLGMCIANKFSHTRIPPFLGGPTRISQSFVLPERTGRQGF
jgi:hypothetical protein